MCFIISHASLMVVEYLCTFVEEKGGGRIGEVEVGELG